MNLDRNTLTGLLLMLVLGLGYSWYSAVSMEPVPDVPVPTAVRQQARVEEEQQAAPVPAADTLAAADSAAQAVLAGKYGIFAPAVSGPEEIVVLRNGRIRAELSTRGGMFRSVTLTDGYLRYQDSTQVMLWDSTLSAMGIAWKEGNTDRHTKDFYFIPDQREVDATLQPGTLTMRLPVSDPAVRLELVYTLKPDSYLVECSVRMNGLEMPAGAWLDWRAAGVSNEKGLQAERGKCSVYFRPVDGERDYLSESSEDEEVTEEPTNWMAFKQDFFSAAVISSGGFTAGSRLAVTVPEDSVHTKYFEARLGLPLKKEAEERIPLVFFFGPNDYKVLRAVDAGEFDRLIDYGWGIIGWLNKYAIRPVFWFFSSFIGSFGLIILIVTLLIKMVLFPVTWKNYLSSAKMRVLKPEMDEINKKYEGKEPVEKQQAIMSLYRQTGVNPFAGCVPVLIQMPILYAMFRFFPAEIVLRGKSFLWADDLAAYDSILSLPFNIPFYGSHVSGFTLLMCASTFLYTRMSTANQPMTTQPGMPNMKVMMNIFTFMMLFFFNGMPSGLSMYYFTANMISIGQMWVIKNYIIDEAAIRAKIEENKKKPKKKSTFQQRLEEMQKAQQKKVDAQKKKK